MLQNLILDMFHKMHKVPHLSPTQIAEDVQMDSFMWGGGVMLQSVLTFPLSSRKSARLEDINSYSKEKF